MAQQLIANLSQQYSSYYEQNPNQSLRKMAVQMWRRWDSLPIMPAMPDPPPNPFSCFRAPQSPLPDVAEMMKRDALVINALARIEELASERQRMVKRFAEWISKIQNLPKALDLSINDQTLMQEYLFNVNFLMKSTAKAYFALYRAVEAALEMRTQEQDFGLDPSEAALNMQLDAAMVQIPDMMQVDVNQAVGALSEATNPWPDKFGHKPF